MQPQAIIADELDARQTLKAAEQLISIAERMDRIDRELGAIWSALPASTQDVVEPMFYTLNCPVLLKAANDLYEAVEPLVTF